MSRGVFARQRRVAHPVSVTHTCMNESLELSLLCSVHTATVVYIGTYRTLCIHLQPVQQRGHHKQAIASLAALVLGRPQVLVSVGHGRDNRHSCLPYRHSCVRCHLDAAIEISIFANYFCASFRRHSVNTQWM